jgi:glyoxylase-like metal-dependent hydrolase (beta-lactamase superfamily II)
MTRIMDDVYTWDWFSERHGYDFHGTWIASAGGNLAIDPVDGPDDVLGRFVEYKVDRILLTNRNHFRAAEKLRLLCGARVSVHPADAAFVRGKGVTVDEELLPGQKIGPLQVLAAAGKSPGEVAFFWPERRLLIVGDACIGNPPGKLGLPSAGVTDDPAALRASLVRIAEEVDFDVLIVGDGTHILTGARAALRALVASFSS